MDKDDGIINFILRQSTTPTTPESSFEPVISFSLTPGP